MVEIFLYLVCTSPVAWFGMVQLDKKCNVNIVHTELSQLTQSKQYSTITHLAHKINSKETLFNVSRKT